MKICFLIAGFGQGGAQKQCINLLNSLKERNDVEVSLIYFYEGENFSELNIKDLDLFKVESGSFYNPINIFKICKLVRDIKPKILFSWLQASDVYAYFIRLFSPGLKWVMAERDSSYPSDVRFYLRSYLGRRANLIVANSRKGCEYWLERGVDSEKLVVIGNIVKRPFQGGGEEADRKLVLYAGRLEDQKNVINLSNAFVRLAKEFPHYEFSIVGDGSHYGLISNSFVNIENANIFPFTKEIEGFYKKTKLFVNPSLHEGLPNTVIENVVFGNDIVVSNIDEHRDIMGDEYAGYIKYPFSDLEIYNAVKKAVEDEILDTSFAEIVVSNMTKENVTDRYISLFKMV